MDVGNGAGGRGARLRRRRRLRRRAQGVPGASALRLPACGRSLDPAVQLQQHARSERAAPVHSLAGRLRAAEPGSERRGALGKRCCRRPIRSSTASTRARGRSIRSAAPSRPSTTTSSTPTCSSGSLCSTQSPVWAERARTLRQLPARAAVSSAPPVRSDRSRKRRRSRSGSRRCRASASRSQGRRPG